MTSTTSPSMSMEHIKERLKLIATNNETMSPADASIVALAFAPNHREALQSQAYLSLSAYFAKWASVADSDSSRLMVASPFTTCIGATLADPSAETASSGLGLLMALYQVHEKTGLSVLSHDGIVDSMEDSIATFENGTVPIDAAHLIGQICGHKPSRALITTTMRTWLERQSYRQSDSGLSTAAMAALVKLQQGDAVDATRLSSTVPKTDHQRIIANAKSVLCEDSDMMAASDAVEGLAYLSRDPDIAQEISEDDVLLRLLFSKVPRKQSIVKSSSVPQSTLIFGVAVTILNLVAYRPRLSHEQENIERIRRMANAGAASGKLDEETLPLTGDDAHVKLRGAKLIELGVVDALVATVKMTDSRATRLSTGRSLLHLAENQENRGKMLKSGASKALMTIISGLMPPTKDGIPSKDVLEPIQALAKLSITASPVQVFGAGSDMSLDAIRPLTTLLTHTDNTALQRFEAMMALTNLAGQGPGPSDRIANTSSLISRVEMLMLDDHNLTRRAATELICNLVANAESIFNRYAGGQASKSRLQVIVALVDVDDTPTQLAASGALAMLTSSPLACQLLANLQLERHRVFAILRSLLDMESPNIGLIHRSIACVQNLLAGTADTQMKKQLANEAESAGFVTALVLCIKGLNPGSPGSTESSVAAVLSSAVNTLKEFVSLGVTVTI